VLRMEMGWWRFWISIWASTKLRKKRALSSTLCWHEHPLLALFSKMSETLLQSDANTSSNIL
jgi:hypothetical protein